MTTIPSQGNGDDTADDGHGDECTCDKTAFHVDITVSAHVLTSTALTAGAAIIHRLGLPDEITVTEINVRALDGHDDHDE